ncbi:mitogen-activated protein kinase kinase kinase YODA-like [Cucumis melo var. makuwa]|uniref:Mitogen-activated protein kinase kinase kinase YODA-like n=1 Tax=Cucumis melo var. makuwa TaxID=1194695 RepID=A0A5A7USC4_CUCMM|nr:mitogen-activated protein kinase kinase kinase YODA-like [Cucumis melo var. makuwa]
MVNWEPVKVLGKGSCASVFLAKSTMDPLHYFAVKLEYAAGGTLTDLIEQRKKLSENEVKEYLKMILKGLSCIHRKGFVHADLKPANILAFPQNNGKMKLKIADFGISRRCVQMVSEEPVWEDFSSITYLVAKLVHGMEIPEELSEKGKDFVKRCFDRDPKQRWTADMLLEHPYLEKENETRNKRSGATYTFKRCSIK